MFGKSGTNLRYIPSPSRSLYTTYLQSVGEQLVHAGHLGGDGKVDGTVANLDNKTTTDIRVDLVMISIGTSLLSNMVTERDVNGVDKPLAQPSTCFPVPRTGSC